MPRPSGAKSPLALESLERRDAFAGDVMAVMYGQMLVIWGDSAANGVVLSYSSNLQNYEVAGKDAGGAPTTINGQAQAASFGNVQSVAVLLNGGDDAFSVGSPAAVDTVIRQWLSIDMGDGNDTVQLGQGGNAPGGDAPIALHLRTGTSVNIDLGAGDDHLGLANAEIGLALNVSAGDGNDDVLFATEFSPEGSSAALLFPVVVGGNTSISLGGGEDELQILNAVLQGHLRILDGAGLAHLNIDNVSIAKNLDIDTAASDDQITINFVNARNVTIDSNGGIDDVDFTNCRFRSMIVKLGSQRDALLLRNVRVTFLTRLDGGDNGSRLAGSNNMLRGLTRRNIG